MDGGFWASFTWVGGWSGGIRETTVIFHRLEGTGVGGDRPTNGERRELSIWIISDALRITNAIGKYDFQRQRID